MEALEGSQGFWHKKYYPLQIVFNYLGGDFFVKTARQAK
jgi:hypothetical protein